LTAECATSVQALMVVCYMQEAFASEKAQLEDRIKALGEEAQAMLARHALELKQHSRDFEKKMNDFVEKADNVIPMFGCQTSKLWHHVSLSVNNIMTSTVPPAGVPEAKCRSWKVAGRSAAESEFPIKLMFCIALVYFG
jgi:hypothetical protein